MAELNPKPSRMRIITREWDGWDYIQHFEATYKPFRMPEIVLTRQRSRVESTFLSPRFWFEGEVDRAFEDWLAVDDLLRGVAGHVNLAYGVGEIAEVVR